MVAVELETSKRSAKLRAFFASYVTERGGARDPRIEQAFASVPREPFAGEPPWFIAGPLSLFPVVPRYTPTPDDDPAFLYQDVLVALDPARGINIGEPGFHAFCLEALAVRRSETAIHVGAGSGYYSAILAHLVGKEGRIQAYEIDQALACRAKRNLAPFPWVQIHERSGSRGDLPKADVIYVSAACTSPSRDWLDALNPGGRLLFPLQHERNLGGMLLIQRPLRSAAAWPARIITRAIFIACEGLQNIEDGRRVAEAFAAGGRWMEVRSLRSDEAFDASCWCRGEGWWLSTSPDTVMETFDP